MIEKETTVEGRSESQVKGTSVIEQIDAKKGVCAVGGVTPHTPSLTSKNPPDRMYPRKKLIYTRYKTDRECKFKVKHASGAHGPGADR